MTKARKWTYALSALLTAAAVVLSGPTAAQATPDSTCTNLTVDGTNWGGTYFCNYSFEQAYLQNGDWQVWVVAGSGHNVFTRWQKPNKTMSAWVNMGGNVKSNGNASWLESTTWVPGGGRFDEIIKVKGLDSDDWCNVRNGATNSWNGWSEAHCANFG